MLARNRNIMTYLPKLKFRKSQTVKPNTKLFRINRRQLHVCVQKWFLVLEMWMCSSLTFIYTKVPKHSSLILFNIITLTATSTMRYPKLPPPDAREHMWKQTYSAPPTTHSTSGRVRNTGLSAIILFNENLALNTQQIYSHLEHSVFPSSSSKRLSLSKPQTEATIKNTSTNITLSPKPGFSI